MRQVSTLLNVYGRAWLFVGSPSFDGPVDRERAERERLRPYCVALSPLSVLDWAYGPDRRLVWAKIEELHTYDWDPDVVRRTVHRVRLWTRDQWRLYDPLTGAITEGVNPTGRDPARGTHRAGWIRHRGEPLVRGCGPHFRRDPQQ